ncbi:uncharacterized protein A4U43_C04F4470 [Asparagus officinalis]|uniref:DNA2/NAM7 helicase-like C-terminal domain-containing protein n=1 Tax=Asparagus officinalis TaxID=4686 RepID=A0A5P1EYB3_ASPOF|nr:uncharacterized protein A4U43_C04F4470 [Asparagus officinalis]
MSVTDFTENALSQYGIYLEGLVEDEEERQIIRELTLKEFVNKRFTDNFYFRGKLQKHESAIRIDKNYWELSGVRHAIFIGDEHQLPALVKSQVSENAAFGRNLFERLSSLGHEKHLLNVQYRMHPSISKFPNSNFYDKKISDGPNVMCDSYEQKYLAGSMYGSYSFKNIQSGKESRDSKTESLKNMIEVTVIQQIIKIVRI